MSDKDEILRAIEGVRGDVSLLNARTADLGVRISVLEDRPRRPMPSVSSEVLAHVESVAASIPPMAAETTRQTGQLGSILSHQRLFAVAAVITALAALYGAIFGK